MSAPSKQAVVVVMIVLSAALAPLSAAAKAPGAKTSTTSTSLAKAPGLGTRAAFVKNANPICEAGAADLATKFRALGYTSAPVPKSPEEVTMKKRLAPLVSTYLTTTASKIGALARPASDAVKIDRLVAVLRKASVKINADYRTIDNANLVDEANSIARSIGLSVCAA